MASSDPRASLALTLKTTLLLIDQFSASLSGASPSTQSTTAQDPLPLLTVSSSSLKQNVTRLSLLTLTPPFSPSAMAPLLNAMNTSILPSMVTACHLITPAAYTNAFCSEAASLAKQCLLDSKALLQLVSDRASSAKKDLSTAEKNAITQATGQAWARCDGLNAFAQGGLAGFMAHKVGQWLDLMRDAVKELEEWDPDEEVGDDPFGLNDLEGEDQDDNTSKTEQNSDRAVLQAGVKTEALKVLTRIPQSIHVVVKQRLGPKHLPEVASLSPSQRSTLDSIVTSTRKVSEAIDESAEAMYMGDLEQCLKAAGEARSLAIDVVESVRDQWTPGVETKEDVYIKRALVWIRQVQPTSSESKDSVNSITNRTKAIEIG